MTVECVECGNPLSKKDYQTNHPEFPADALCHECAPTIYLTAVEDAMSSYETTMTEIIEHFKRRSK